ncbi:hypothetical protein [Nannocystis pusilla]|uniref:hypothetical protein n=1 Tax=Nannocystis pusilla TaxID=889268 RepID=UPI003B7EDE6A
MLAASSRQLAAPSVTRMMNCGWPSWMVPSSASAALTPLVAGVPPLMVASVSSAPGMALRIDWPFIGAISTSGVMFTGQAVAL